MTSKSIAVSRTYRASPQAAFDAWTKPEMIEQWFGPPGYSAHVVEHDFRVGGDWRFLMKGDAGDGLVHFGTFIAIDPPDRLTFTWASEAPLDTWRSVDGQPTLVVVTFEPCDAGVIVTISHEGLALETARHGLTIGWGEGLACLENFLRDRAGGDDGSAD